MATGTITRNMVSSNLNTSLQLAMFTGTAATNVTLDYDASLFALLSLLLYDTDNNVVGVFTTAPTYFRNLTFKVFGESSSQWGSMSLGSGMTTATFNRTSSNTSKVRLVGIGRV